jgi:ATP-dependent Zn protease
MNLRAKIVIGCAILACVAGVLWMTARSRHSLPEYTYSQFLDEVHSGHVASAVVAGSTSTVVEATFRLKDGGAARTVLPPDYRDALRAMRDNFVDIEIRGSSLRPFPLLMNAAPFLLLLIVWVLLIWKLPNCFNRALMG